MITPYEAKKAYLEFKVECRYQVMQAVEKYIDTFLAENYDGRRRGLMVSSMPSKLFRPEARKIPKIFGNMSWNDIEAEIVDLYRRNGWDVEVKDIPCYDNVPGKEILFIEQTGTRTSIPNT